MKIILVRHGETDWNREQRYQGHKDIAMNDAGRTQARDIAARLESEKVEAIFSSDLSRTLETAAIIAEYHKLPIRIDSRFREMAFGEWEGLTFKEVYAKYPAEFREWCANTGAFRVPGGESVEDLLARVWPALLEISQCHRNTVVVSTHGGVLRALLYHLQGEQEALWQERLGNGSMIKICIEGEHAHLLSE